MDYVNRIKRFLAPDAPPIHADPEPLAPDVVKDITARFYLPDGSPVSPERIELALMRAQLNELANVVEDIDAPLADAIRKAVKHSHGRVPPLHWR